MRQPKSVGKLKIKEKWRVVQGTKYHNWRKKVTVTYFRSNSFNIEDSFFFSLGEGGITKILKLQKKETVPKNWRNHSQNKWLTFFPEIMVTIVMIVRNATIELFSMVNGNGFKNLKKA